jgi:hypothetical protein
VNGIKKKFNLFSFKLIFNDITTISNQILFGISMFNNDNYQENKKKYGTFEEKYSLFNLINVNKLLFYKKLTNNDKKELGLNNDKIFFSFKTIFCNDLGSFKNKYNSKCYNICEDVNFNIFNDYICKKKNFKKNFLFHTFVGAKLKKNKHFTYFKKRCSKKEDIFLMKEIGIDTLHLTFSFSRIFIKILKFLIDKSNNENEKLNLLLLKYNIKIENIEGETIENLLKEEFINEYFLMLKENSKLNSEEILKFEKYYLIFLNSFKNFYKIISSTNDLNELQIEQLYYEMDIMTIFIEFFSQYIHWTGYYIILFTQIVYLIHKFKNLQIFNLSMVELLNKFFKKTISTHIKYGGSINNNIYFKKLLTNQKIPNDNSSQLLLNVLFVLNENNNDIKIFENTKRCFFYKKNLKNENFNLKNYNLYEKNEKTIIEKNNDYYNKKLKKFIDNENIKKILQFEKDLKLDLNFLNPNKNKIKLIDLNDEIKNYLKENQKKAIEFFLKNLFEKKIYKNLLLGEPGSGKTNVFTLISLIVLNKMENIKIIIISPKSNLYQIKSEYENLFKNFNILV